MSIMSILFAVVAVSIFDDVFPGKSQEFRDAVRYGAETKVVFHVVDDEGQPVKEASVGAAFYMHGKKGYVVEGLTDVNGRFEAVQQCVGEVRYGIDKPGYYDTNGYLKFAGNVHKRGEVKDGRWQPYGKTYKVVLKKKRNPHPMIATLTDNWINISQTNVVMGFDLERNALVKPHGDGEITDFTIEFQTDGKKFLQCNGSSLIIRFVRPFDGFYFEQRDLFSDFGSVYHADTNHVFKQELTLFTRRRPDMKWDERILNKDEYLVLRTRSEVDEKGGLKSAHYSYMGYLRFSFGAKTLGVFSPSYRYNPIANDTNLELDIRRFLEPLK